MTEEDAIKLILNIHPFPGWSADSLYPHLKDQLSRLDFEILFEHNSHSIIHTYKQYLLHKLKNPNRQCIDKSIGTTQTVISLIQLHFTDLETHKEAEFASIRQCNAQASNLTFSLRLADLVWRIAGDQSTDMNYYSKRATLAAIYTSTLLYWYHTQAPIHEIIDFFAQRLQNLHAITKAGKTLEKSAKNLIKNTQLLRKVFSNP